VLKIEVDLERVIESYFLWADNLKKKELQLNLRSLVTLKLFKTKTKTDQEKKEASLDQNYDLKRKSLER